MSPFKRRIIKQLLGQVLIQKGVITPEKLDQALRHQKEHGGLLGEILIKLGVASEEDIVQALAIQHDFPYLPLANYEIDSEAKKLIPESLARKYYILPVDKMGDILTVVMANPLDEKTIGQIRTLTNCKVEIFVATYTEISEAVKRCYTQKESDQEGESGDVQGS